MFELQSFRREGGVTLFGPDPHCAGNNTASRRHDVLTYPIIRDGMHFAYLLTFLRTYSTQLTISVVCNVI